MEKSVSLKDVGIFQAIPIRFWESALDKIHFRYFGRESQAPLADVIGGLEITETYSNGTGTVWFSIQMEDCMVLLGLMGANSAYELYLASNSPVALDRAVKDF